MFFAFYFCRYFIDAPNKNGDYVARTKGQYGELVTTWIILRIIDHILSVGKMQNISYGLNEDCLAALSKTNEEWKCGNAQV